MKAELECPDCKCTLFVKKNVFPKWPAITYYHTVQTICTNCDKVVKDELKL